MAGWKFRIAAGVSVAAVAFGSLAPAAAIRAPFAPPADVGGRVWLDVNGDGRRGGLAEPGLAGISVALRNATGTELATTETGQDGVYQFGGLEAGAYAVRVLLPEGTFATIRDPLSIDPMADPGDSDIGPDGMTVYFKIASGDVIQSIGAGLLRLPVLTARMDAIPTPEKAVYNDSLIEYRIWVTNTAGTAALDVVVTDAIPKGSFFWEVTGGAGGFVKPGVLAWQFEAMQPGVGYRVSFVVVAFRLEDVGWITNFAQVASGAGITETNTVFHRAYPYAVQLQSLSATRGNDAAGHPIVTVDWVIAGENGTLGYRVWRGASAERGGAEVVSGGLIAATGIGGRYAWVDAAAPIGLAYYWIEEVELDGQTVTDYGPVSAPAALTRQVSLPTLMR